MNLSTFNFQFSILILNGPNLNRLGVRKPEIYGNRTMAQILLDIQQRWPDIHFVYRQSNHEGDLIDWIQEVNDQSPGASSRQTGGAASAEKGYYQSPMTNDQCHGIVLNAGGYTHTSVALRDAVEDSEIPVIEVHISDIAKREPFRHTSLLTDVCAHSIIGHGVEGYAEAVQWLLTQNNTQG